MLIPVKLSSMLRAIFMTRIVLRHPDIHACKASFSWTVDPPCSLYKTTAFTLYFPDTIRVDKVPESVWWTIFLTCLHSHWILLRPCTVTIPVRLPPGHLEVWRRLLDAEIDTADAYRESPPESGGVELVESGDPVEPPVPVPEHGRCATAFSGGRPACCAS